MLNLLKGAQEETVTGAVRRLCLFIVFVALGGCAADARYVAPADLSVPEFYELTLERPFDDVWEALELYPVGTFYRETSFQRERGYASLTFEAREPSQYVDGGEWDYRERDVRFQGNYVDFITQYREGRLTGRVEVFLMPVGAARTAVRVSARYVLHSDQPDVVVRTGRRAVVKVARPPAGTPETRVLVPTYRLEREILRALTVG